MKVYYSKLRDEDILAIDEKLEGMREFSLTLPYCSKASDLMISRGLNSLLEQVYKVDLHQNLEFIINELIANASKANLKRAYFKKRGLNISNGNEYQAGMKSFYRDGVLKSETYLKGFEATGCYIKVKIAIEPKDIVINIENSSELLPIEEANIKNSISLANQFHSINDIYNNRTKYNEGDGYGIILTLLILKKITPEGWNFKFYSKSGSTKFHLRIPVNIVNDEEGEFIANSIVDEIDSMPQLPENIKLLQMELNDPTCSFPRISDLILSDTNLTMEVLRIANSPVFRGTENIEKVSTAVKTIGLIGLRSILYNYGAYEVFNDRYNIDAINTVKEHQFSVALIAAYIANIKSLNNFSEDIFVAGLLHDIGRIVVNALNRELIREIDNICHAKKISLDILDNLFNGYNHSLIGELLAKKWNFPNKYINSIGFHHNPLKSPEEFKPICYTVYLADQIYYVLNGERNYSSININILKYFNLDSEKEFNRTIDELKKDGLFF